MQQNSLKVTFFASLQWMFFIFANIVVVPISIGLAFDLPTYEVVTILRSSLIITGIACILQALIGHKYPLLEGHSGVMWALMLNLGASAPTLGLSLIDIGGGVATGMLLAGAVVILLAACGATPIIQKIFSPMVMNVFLMLLTFQLAFIFFKGMLKINDDGTLNMAITIFSVIVAIFVAILKIKGNAIIGNFSLLIGIIVGWILYALIFPAESLLSAADGAQSSFRFFPLGKPNLQYGIIFITFLGCILNMSNTFASINAVSKLNNSSPKPKQYRNSLFLTGVYSVVASLFGLVSYAPFASSVGFLESTQIYDKKPFLIGGAIITILGIIPSLGLMLATIPITVGNAVLFVAYLQLLGTTLKGFQGHSFNSISIHRIAIPILVGVSLLATDATIFANFPSLVQPLLSNGFIVGVLLSILLETTVKWDKKLKSSTSDHGG
ncbi:MAG TPA: uracil/xanthine transporter [Candidatus Paenibacillus intestinavium]|nr:uracil/xanthine transporter [Candidatus Paenibacillus intestinavium]